MSSSLKSIIQKSDSSALPKEKSSVCLPSLSMRRLSASYYAASITGRGLGRRSGPSRLTLPPKSASLDNIDAARDDNSGLDIV
jgi:hypothetical protein